MVAIGARAISLRFANLFRRSRTENDYFRFAFHFFANRPIQGHNFDVQIVVILIDRQIKRPFELVRTAVYAHLRIVFRLFNLYAVRTKVREFAAGSASLELAKKEHRRQIGTGSGNVVCQRHLQDAVERTAEVAFAQTANSELLSVFGFIPSPTTDAAKPFDKPILFAMPAIEQALLPAIVFLVIAPAERIPKFPQAFAANQRRAQMLSRAVVVCGRAIGVNVSLDSTRQHYSGARRI